MPKPRVPTKLKMLKGTFRHNESPKNEPAPPIVNNIPAPPAHLNKWAKAMWRDLAPKLFDLGMLTEVDPYALEVLCVQYGLYRELYDAVTHIRGEDGKRARISVAQYLAGQNSQTIPEFAAMKSAFERFSALLREFGLSPASRSRIDIPRKEPVVADPMEAILEAR